MEQPRGTVCERLTALFEQRGSAEYGGEAISQFAHALQTAWQAEQAGATPALIVAALLHDVGHLLHDLAPGDQARGTDDHHEALGARWLSQYFGTDVTTPVQWHVAAKRYLCATEPAYFATLSPGSVRSLAVQGGPFTAAQAARFITQPWAPQAVALRRWDERAKVPGLVTPDFGHFLSYVEAVMHA